MLGQRAGGIHDRVNKGGEHVGQGHAGAASAPLGQGGQDGAETFPERGQKACRGRLRRVPGSSRHFFHAPL